jgi:superfamily II DNA or RNA helicase
VQNFLCVQCDTIIILTLNPCICAISPPTACPLFFSAMIDFSPSMERSPRSTPVQQYSQPQTFPYEQPLSINAAYHAILREDGGQRIFASFGLDVGKRYVSPFRADAHRKNFSVFQDKSRTVCFKDFASGEAGTFTALLQNFGYHSFEAQIRYAAAFYGFTLHDTVSSPTSAPVRPQQPRTYSAPPKKKVIKTAFYCVPELHAEPFTSDELQTLQRLSGGLLTPEVLERFGIRALRSYTDEGRTEQGKYYGGNHEAHYTLVCPSSDGNEYAYTYYKSDTYSPFPNRAKNFHLKRNEYASAVKFALGLNELRPNEPAYLVEGIKDCLILLAQGYNAFTLGGVQSRLPPSVLEHLQANGNTLAICFDTDFAGIDNARKLQAWCVTQGATQGGMHHATQRAIPASICTLPRLERQETKDAPKPALNDLADYVCQFGFDDALTACLMPAAPLHRTTLTKAGYEIPAWQLSIHNKLMDDAPAMKALMLLMEQTSRLALRAPTGCGKTYTVLRHIAQKHHDHCGGMTVLAVPTVALAEQVRQEYSDLNPIVLTGNDNDLHRLYAEEELGTCCVITTYDSAVRILSLIAEPSTLFVIDEMHKLVQDHHFRSPAMRNMMTLLSTAKHVLGMSATPELLFHEAPMSFTYCNVLVAEKRPLTYAVRSYQKREKAVVATILQTLQTHRADTITFLKRIKKLLIKHGVNENDIDIITADTRTTSPEYKNLTETSRFSRPIILATNVLDCGVNVLNTGTVHVIMADEKNEDTIIQVANRFRTASDIRAEVFYREKKVLPQTGNEHQGSLFAAQTVEPPMNERAIQERPLNEQYHFLHTQYAAQMSAEAFNHADGRNTTADCGVSKRSASRLFDTMLFYDRTRAQWRVDDAAIMHRLSVVRTMRTSTEDVARALEKYGFTKMNETLGKDDSLADSTLNTEYSTLLFAAVVAESKEERERDENIILTLIQEQPAYFFAALLALTRSRSVRDALPRLFPEALLPVMKNHPTTLTIMDAHADLLTEQRTHILVRYYTEARTLGFDHAEAMHLVRMNSDPRKWASFTNRLAIKQREEIHLAGLTDNILSKHDCGKLQREQDIRRLVLSAAQTGCTFTNNNGETRHIPSSIRSKKDLAARVNAHAGTMFRVNQQTAGELVDALFHVRYVRERTKRDDKTVQSGYYTFAEDKSETLNGTLRRKTLAEYLNEYGVDGTRYERNFMQRVQEEATRRHTAQKQAERAEQDAVQELLCRN